jgi:signal transduction histidine kinase
VDADVSADVKRAKHRRLGLRATVTLSFAAGGLVLSTLLSVGTYFVARQYLLDQREKAALGQGFADAAFVRDGLLTAGRPVSDVLGTVSPPADSVVFVRRGGEWYSTSLTARSESVPAPLMDHVAGGGAAVGWARVDGDSAVAVGIPIPAVDAVFYELTVTNELRATLETFATVLTFFAVTTTLAGALLGRWAAGKVLAPLDDVAGAAARIAAGDLGTRLPTTEDPELVTIIGSFNAMVDALSERLERDARFSADVSHELRSPLTTLMTSVGLLEARRHELPEHSREVLDLVVRELERFRRALDDLLELGRLDAAALDRVPQERSLVDARELVRHALSGVGRSPELLRTAEQPLPVLVDKGQLNRALVNLFENADRHGDGLVEVVVGNGAGRDGSDVVICVDDAGPGVPVGDRQRIFERFVRGGSRGSLPGTGLGLSLVRETVSAHGGTVACDESPHGGARFVVRLPRASEEVIG